MRRLLYKFFSGDYLHVVSLMASHFRAQRIRAGLCYAPGCQEHGVVWLDGSGIFCWDHYAEQMRRVRASMPPADRPDAEKIGASQSPVEN